MASPPTRQSLLRRLPGIDTLLASAPLQALAMQIPHALLVAAAQQTVAELRTALLAEEGETPDITPAAVADRAAARARQLAAPSLRPVLNLAGTILHTNLGRAPLAEAALTAIEQVARGYANLEFDLAEGERGRRDSHVEDLLVRLTGAEAATVVNNNAGAVLLALTALARGKEAIVSRGELIEIGGSFRIPEVMETGGVILREVGTTNKTHRHDYAAAIGEATGLLLKVHTSNYRILGFTSAVPAAELVDLGRQHGLPVMEDLGSGMLIDLSGFGLPPEPTVAAAVASGVDVVTFSGDKLLGGPQAGLIVGRRAAVDRIRRHPLARALRSDKLTLAALEATLRLYLDPQRALAEIPTLRMLAIPAAELNRRCQRLQRRITSACGERLQAVVVPAAATVGGGALPLSELPGFALALRPAVGSVAQLAARLRGGEVPVIGRIHEDCLLLDPRTLAAAEETSLIAALAAALG
jgi:L-seryl-tRNA(Ser) seleniumtransferase